MNDTTKPAATVEANAGPSADMAMYPMFEVTVERSNNTKIVVEVPEYEVPVLQQLHGEFSVVKAEESSFEEERPADAAQILEALRRKYNSPNTPDVVGPVYRNADELAKAAGIKVGKAGRPAESLQRDARKKKSAAKK